MNLAIIDFNRTIYDPESDSLVPGAFHALQDLVAKGLTLVLVSRPEAGRAQKFSDLGIADVFSETIFIEDKTPELFAEIISRHRSKPEHVYVIGDHLHQEIHAGNELGAKTIFLKRGKFADLSPKMGKVPWKTITHMSEIAELL